MSVSKLEELKNLINETKWGDRTKKNRINFIISLIEELDPKNEDLEFLNNFELCTDYLLNKYKNTSTRKNKILDIKAMLALLKNETIIKKYDMLADTLIVQNNDIKDNNIVNPEKFISHEDVLKIPGIIEEHIKFIYNKIYLSTLDIDNLNTTIAKFKYLKLLTQYITSILYCHQEPVRADYGIMLLDKKSDTENWFDSKNGIVYFNDFKNVKSMGPVSFKLSNIILSKLNHYITILKHIILNPTRLLYFLHHNISKDFTRETFSTYFIKINKQFIERSLSINCFRHSYEDWIIKSPDYNKMTLADKKKIHDKLLHTIATAHTYITVDN